MTQVIEVTDADVELIFAMMRQTELELMEDDLESFQNGDREMFRLTDEQMDDLEDERPGEAEIAPYILF